MIVQVLFGWPGILTFIVLATIAAWAPNKMLMVVALAWSLPSVFYLLLGNGWTRILALYIPISLGISIYFIMNKKQFYPKLLLFPIYVFYACLGYTVVTQ